MDDPDTYNFNRPMSTAVAPAGARPRGVAFVALRHREFRMFLPGTITSMMADNIEHVITYWVLWQTFHSPVLAGFAVVSHWLPVLLFSVYIGGIADRFDCRRVIQASQGLFMAVSLTWALLFLTGTLQMWHALVLLVLHGFAAALWMTPEQLILHDIVGREHLESAVRLNATGRQIGIVLGPAVGGALLLLAGPTHGMMINVLIYLPLSLILMRITATGHKQGAVARKISLSDAWTAVGAASSNRLIMAMIVMAGVASVLIGNYQPQMPEFARDLGTTDAGLTYSALLISAGLGAVVGGIFLEASRLARANVLGAITCAALWGVSVAGFAMTSNYAAAMVFLFIGGFVQLAFGSMAQTVVQLEAPPELRGRLIGAFIMAQAGLRTFSGLTIGLGGAAAGLHPALAAGGLLTLLGALAVFVYVGWSPPRPLAYSEAIVIEENRPCC